MSSFFMEHLFDPFEMKCYPKSEQVAKWFLKAQKRCWSPQTAAGEGNGYAALFRTRRMVIPVNIANKHWTGIAVDIVAHTATYMDGMLEEMPTPEDRVHARLRAVDAALRFFATANGMQEPEPLNMPGAQGVPRQLDSVSCGLFLCLNALCFVRGKRMGAFGFDQTHMPLYRKLFTLDLLCALNAQGAYS